MKSLRILLSTFDRFDTRMNRWMVHHSITLLRIGMGLVFVGFGLLKFFPGISPIEDLATRTTQVLTFGVLTGRLAMDFVAALECIIGLCFLTGRFLRLGVWLMAAQMLGALSPLVLYPAELFPAPLHAPTLAAQYILKDVILVAAGMVIAATWSGARIVAEHRTFRGSFRKNLPRVERLDAAFIYRVA